jgi:hypothetical protein
MLMSDDYNTETNNTQLPGSSVQPSQPPVEPGSANTGNSDQGSTADNTASNVSPVSQPVVTASAPPAVPPVPDPATPPTAVLTPTVLSQPQTISTQTPGSGPSKPKFNQSLVFKVLALVIVLVAVAFGAYHLGRSHEKIVIQAPTPQPVNLPPQATVLTACVPGRGKQYIIPKDIPTGPIYDVYNSKVIAVEYNLNLGQLFENSTPLSNAILSTIKNYNVTQFSFVPEFSGSAAAAASASAASAASQQDMAAQLSNISSVHLVISLVPTSTTDKITCGSTAAQ